MADIVSVSGNVSIGSSGTTSGRPTTSLAIDEKVSVDHGSSLRLTLVSDSPVPITLDGTAGLGNASFVLVRATSKVRVRLTSGDGSQQAIPGTFMLVKSEDVPFTALDITRMASTETTVDITIGVKPA